MSLRTALWQTSWVAFGNVDTSIPWLNSYKHNTTIIYRQSFNFHKTYASLFIQESIDGLLTGDDCEQQVPSVALCVQHLTTLAVIWRLTTAVVWRQSRQRSRINIFTNTYASVSYAWRRLLCFHYVLLSRRLSRWSVVPCLRIRSTTFLC